jgi:hypothetical protein
MKYIISILIFTYLPYNLLSKEIDNKLKIDKLELNYSSKIEKEFSNWIIEENIKYKIPKYWKAVKKIKKIKDKKSYFEALDGTSMVVYQDKSILEISDYNNMIIKEMSRYNLVVKSKKDVKINKQKFLITKGEFITLNDSVKKEFILYILLSEIDNKKIVIVLTTLKENLKENQTIYNSLFSTLFIKSNKVKKKIYYNKTKNYSIDIPSFWKKDSRTEDGFIFKDLSFNILSYHKGNLEKFVNNYIKELEKDYSTKVFNRKIQKNTNYQISFEIKFKNKENSLIIKFIFYQHEDNIYLLTLGGTEKSVIKYYDMIEEMINSFIIL